METKFSLVSGILSYEGHGKKGSIDCHVPEIGGMLNDDEFGCRFLCSPYFSAGSDFYKVNVTDEKGRKHTLGWVIPIGLLDEVEDIYKDFEDIQIRYLHVCAHKMIDYCLKNELLKQEKGTMEDLNISGDLILLVYRLDICSTADINDFIPSFFDKGYHFIEDPTQIDLGQYPYSSFRQAKVDEFKDDDARTSLNIKRVSPVFTGNKFVKMLFNGSLVNIRDPYLRYFSLYQVIEFLMVVVSGNKYYEYVEQYRKEGRHKMKEKLISLTNESTLISMIYEIGYGPYAQEYKNFIDAAKDVIDKIDEKSIKEGSHFYEYMYKIRNLVVHNYIAMREYKEEMDYLTYMFEALIVDLICRTNIKAVENKLIYVIDRDKSARSNRRAFRKALGEVGIE
jgi:hypothetical protein